MAPASGRQSSSIHTSARPETVTGSPSTVLSSSVSSSTRVSDLTGDT
ncbi:hypothetical protein ACRJ4W_50570 [Streptomyces sp. GLT-R25]